MDNLKESLSPLERKIIPFLNHKVKEIVKKSDLDMVSVIRALRFLENKGLLKIKEVRKEIVDLGINGIYYRKTGLPERKLLSILQPHKPLSLEDARKSSGLSENEFKASLGVLKRKIMISLVNGKVSLSANKEDVTKKFPEELLIEALPIEKSSLESEQMFAFNNLKNRKDIIEIKELEDIDFELTQQGKEIAGKEITSDLLEEVTPDIIKNPSKAKFRKYDIQANVPRIYGGKKHFVNQSIEYAKKIWLDLGFKEMTGSMTDTSFWIFDALFTAQDHSVRDMQDSFYIKSAEGALPENKLVESVKKSHESGSSGSKGWQYEWKEDEAKKVLLRTHTTSISAKTLAKINTSELPAKYFAIGKAFRNETIDWSHGTEFYQTEGIVIDENANFRHLLGYLKLFYAKMGFEKIRFRPSFFPYTEPSVEIEVFNKEKQKWFELGGAGMFRPEVTVPLMGKPIPVLAWGQGLDRIIMDFYKISDLRELYSNDIQNLRDKKIWMK